MAIPGKPGYDRESFSKRMEASDRRHGQSRSWCVDTTGLGATVAGLT